MTITYTFAPLQIIFASRFNQNFSDVKSWADTHELLNSSVHGITGSFVDTGTTGQVITAAKRADKFARNVPFESSNARLSLSAGRLKLVGLDGNDPSVTNPVTFVIPSTTSGLSQVVTFTTTTNCTIDDATTADSYFRDAAGTPWGTTSGTAWSENMPLFGYVTTDGTTPALFLARRFNLTTVPATTYLGYKNTPPGTASDYNCFFMSSSNLTVSHQGMPCMPIFMIDVRKNTSDDWTFQTPSAQYFGINNFNKLRDSVYLTPAGQNGAAAGSHFFVSAGTAPIYTSVDRLIYRFGYDGSIMFEGLFQNSAGGTAGAGANQLTVKLPIQPAFSDRQQYGYAFLFNNGSIANVNGICYTDTVAKNDLYFLYQTTLVTAYDTMYGVNQNNVSRSIYFSITVY